MQTIKRYLVPQRTGEFTINMPEHCTVLGLTEQSIAVLAATHDTERLVPKRFLVFLEGEDVWAPILCRYLGVLKREDSFGVPFRMYVFEFIDSPW